MFDQEQLKDAIFLGVHDDTACFALALANSEDATVLTEKYSAEFVDLKSHMALLNNYDCELLMLARFYVYWHGRHQYCGQCGQLTRSAESGHVRMCDDKECNQHYFPSMDPAMIVLISYGDECLLGRQKHWREGMYSNLAGFVEPGETLEESVQREVMEESGVKLKSIDYNSSQAWLFPASLMLAFTAEAVDKELRINKDEIEDAKWFSRAELKEKLETLPYKTSIAYKLISEWMNKAD